MIGEKLGSYEVIEEVGKGGMARVYRAYHPSMDRYVAIKVISQSIADSDDAVLRFQREARLIARLEHIHILPVYDFDGTHNPPYIVMRYLEGGTLKDIMKRGRLPLGEVGYLMQQLCGAIGYAHRQGIVHRDIKPSNIMIDREGNTFVTDFGIARMTLRGSDEGEGGNPITQTGATIGTPDYMSPEQGMGYLDVDHRADVYALGVMFYEMLTGERPYTSNSPMELVIKHLQAPIPSAFAINPDLPEAVDLVIMRALSKDRDDRYQSTTELLDAIMDVVGGQSVSTPARFQELQTEIEAVAYVDKPAPTTSTTASSTQSTLTEQNKVITVLYADASEYAEIVEDEEGVEAARQAVNRFWDAVAGIVIDANGRVIERGERELLALWGAETTQEDDTEQAIKAALTLQVKLRELAANALLDEADEPLPLNIGIHTGLALLTPSMGGPSMGDSGITATGATISLTNRLTKNAAGSILITKEVLRNVQGVFDVEEDAPLRMRGNKEKLPTYRVLMVKPRAFKIQVRGLQGVETDMVGRETELKHLQDAFEDAIEEGETQAITILSDAGLGKSRLLNEFEIWADLNPADFRVFEGRATSNMTHRPYTLLRDVISFRFEILDSDSQQIVREKLEKGIAELTAKQNVEMAHMIGHLVGFDLSDSEYIKGLLEDSKQLTDRGKQLFKRMLVQTCDNMPVVIQLEDMHHADEASLVLLNEFVDENDELPLLMVSLARPELLERFPAWGTGQSFHEIMTLNPLTTRESRQLVKEILKMVEAVPKTLRDLLVDHAEGNPYFMEEVIKMLIEDRVILVGEDQWTIDESKVENLRVPPTLIGLLQTRIDTLLQPERLLLQRAAVIGRIFYDGALIAMNTVDDLRLDNIDEVLRVLIEREFIYERGTSAFEGQHEYIFAKSMMRDVIYEGLLRRQKRVYHVAAAEWLIAVAGERVDEYIHLIAEHYLQGEESEKAAGYLFKAGEKMLYISSLKESRNTFEQIIALLPDGDHDLLMMAKIRLGVVLVSLGENERALQHLDAGLEQARRLNNVEAMVEVFFAKFQLATRWGDYDMLKEIVRVIESIDIDEDNMPALYRRAQIQANAFVTLGQVEEAMQKAQQLVELAEQSGESYRLGLAYNTLGTILSSRRDNTIAFKYYKQAGAHFDKIGNRRGQIMILTNLGEILRLEEKDYQGAIASNQQAYNLSVEMDDVQGQIICLLNMGLAAFGLQNAPDVIRYSQQVLQLSLKIKDVVMTLLGIQNFAGTKIIEGDMDTALAWLGMTFVHPAADYAMKDDARVFLDVIREKGYAEEAIETGLKEGEGLELDVILGRIAKDYAIELKG